jgi:hypothetical protein
MEARDLDAKLSPVTRIRESDMVHVVLEVDGRLVDPVGTIDVERDADQTAPENRRDIEAPPHVREDVAQAHMTAGGSGWIVDTQRRHMHALVVAFQREEEFVQSAQLFHQVCFPIGSKLPAPA